MVVRDNEEWVIRSLNWVSSVAQFSSNFPLQMNKASPSPPFFVLDCWTNWDLD